MQLLFKQNHFQGLLALRPLSEFLAVRRFREVSWRNWYRPQFMWVLKPGYKTGLLRGRQYWHSSTWADLSSLPPRFSPGFSLLLLPSLPMKSSYMHPWFSPWPKMQSWTQHLDLSEKNFLEVDSHLVANAFSRYLNASLEFTLLSIGGLCIVYTDSGRYQDI